MGKLLNLLEPRHSADLTLDVLDQPRDQFIVPVALGAFELVRVVGWGTEMAVERGEGPESAMAEVALVGCAVECSLACRVMYDRTTGSGRTVETTSD